MRSDLEVAIRRALYGVLASHEDPLLVNDPPLDRHHHQLHILLTEDNAINQMVAMRLLQKWGHTVVVANSGRESIDIVERERFDLILMDVQMAGLDGLEATRAIRQRESTAGDHTPIVAMTAYAMQGDRERCLEAGMDGYLSKPIQQRELFELIERLIGTSPHTGSSLSYTVSPTGFLPGNSCFDASDPRNATRLASRISSQS